MSRHAARGLARSFVFAALLVGFSLPGPPSLAFSGDKTAARAQRAAKRVVVLTGLPGSGKSTLAAELSKSLGNAPSHRCSNVLRKWIANQGLPLNKETDLLASKTFAETPGRLMTELSKSISRSRKPVHIVDGVRSKADLKVLQDKFGAENVQVLAMTLPKAERYRRLARRARYGDTEKSAFEARDRREIGLGVLHVLRAPFRRVDMSGPIEAVPGIATQLAQDLNRAWK